MLLWLLKIGLLVYVGFGLLLYLTQRQIMYYPTPAHDSRAIDSLWLDSNGHRIKLWVLAADAEDALIYFGGNGEDVFYTAQSFAGQLTNRAVYLVNYRGYGGSSGKPTEAGLYADALAAFDFVSRRHRSVAVAGRSLGSGVAVYLAAQRPVDRLVLITPPDSAARLAAQLYPIYPVNWMLKDRYDSVRYAPGVNTPVLVITAAQDTLVPAANSARLIDALRDGSVTPVVIEDAGHNDLSRDPGYMAAIRDHLAKAVTPY